MDPTTFTSYLNKHEAYKVRTFSLGGLLTGLLKRVPSEQKVFDAIEKELLKAKEHRTRVLLVNVVCPFL